MKKLRHLLYLILLIALDQLTKYYAVTQLKKESVTIIPKVFKLLYHENTGAVWGILSNQTGLLVVFSSIIMLAMIFFYFKIPADKHYNYLRIVLVFITAGAIGNLIDRIFRKYVVDFLYFELINFPIFNVADCYVTVASVVLIILFIFYYKDEDFEFWGKSSKKKSA
ncbi:signal peptidase II [Anaerocolumna aminovalerica]|uniref:signal peptidase II n=1 Tax=Anaerocolumna aminovalerica TaxID=1527 RepID=UPI001C0F2D11|nr:signal peptidase II [Anaerocolumna aminovalerica]MBU5332589.1 signal peptidase II [Anaerocolumna aminovalerica]